MCLFLRTSSKCTLPNIYTFLFITNQLLWIIWPVGRNVAAGKHPCRSPSLSDWLCLLCAVSRSSLNECVSSLFYSLWQDKYHWYLHLQLHMFLFSAPQLSCFCAACHTSNTGRMTGRIHSEVTGHDEDHMGLYSFTEMLCSLITGFKWT